MLGNKEAPAEEESEPNTGAILTLNADNFQQGIAQGVSFVKFFAPWCAYCKRLAPTWNELSKKILGISNVRLVKVDCTLENSKELCNEQEVSKEGFNRIISVFNFFLSVSRLQFHCRLKVFQRYSCIKMVKRCQSITDREI